MSSSLQSHLAPILRHSSAASSSNRHSLLLSSIHSSIIQSNPSHLNTYIPTAGEYLQALVQLVHKLLDDDGVSELTTTGALRKQTGVAGGAKGRETIWSCFYLLEIVIPFAIQESNQDEGEEDGKIYSENGQGKGKKAAVAEEEQPKISTRLLIERLIYLLSRKDDDRESIIEYLVNPPSDNNNNSNNDGGIDATSTGDDAMQVDDGGAKTGKNGKWSNNNNKKKNKPGSNKPAPTKSVPGPGDSPNPLSQPLKSLLSILSFLIIRHQRSQSSSSRTKPAFQTTTTTKQTTYSKRLQDLYKRLILPSLVNKQPKVRKMASGKVLQILMVEMEEARGDEKDGGGESENAGWYINSTRQSLISDLQDCLEVLNHFRPGGGNENNNSSSSSGAVVGGEKERFAQSVAIGLIGLIREMVGEGVWRVGGDGDGDGDGNGGKKAGGKKSDSPSSSSLLTILLSLLSLPPSSANEHLTSPVYSLLDSIFRSHSPSSIKTKSPTKTKTKNQNQNQNKPDDTSLSLINLFEKILSMRPRPRGGADSGGKMKKEEVEIGKGVDEKELKGWIEAMDGGWFAVARSAPQKLPLLLPNQFSSTLLLLASPSSQVRQSSENCLTTMIRYCITELDLKIVYGDFTDDLRYKKLVDGEDDDDQEERVGRAKETRIVEMISKKLLKSLNSLTFHSNPLSIPHLLSLIKSFVSHLRYRPPVSSSTSASSVEALVRPVPLASLIVKDLVKAVGKMRDSDRFEWGKEAEGVIGMTAEVCGPEWLLSGDVLPLNLGVGENDDDMDGDGTSKANGPERTYLLPLLKNSISNTPLQHFKDYFLPLSSQLFTLISNPTTSPDLKQTLQMLLDQIFGLLPGYLNLPPDLSTSFNDQSFLNTLSNILYTRPTLRPSIIKSLTILIQSVKSLSLSGADEGDMKRSLGITPSEAKIALDSNNGVVGGKAMGLLGVLFNLFGKMGKGEGGYVLECVEVWLGILSKEDLMATFDKINNILSQLPASSPAPPPPTKGAPPPPQPTTHAMLDLLTTLSSISPPSLSIKLFAQSATSDKFGIRNKDDQVVQKKGYKLLGRLFERNDEGMEAMKRMVLSETTGASTGEDGVIEKLIEGSEMVAIGAKRDRMALLASIIPRIPSDRLHLIPSLIPETVLGTKEANEGAREASYSLLVAMGKKMGAGGVVKRGLVKGMEDDMSDDAPASIEEFFTMVSVGLAGSSQHMISATITSLSRLLFEFHASLPKSTVDDLITTINVYLQSKSKELVKASVGFVKVSLVTLPPHLLEPHLSDLIPNLLKWSHEHRNHLKSNIRSILGRMMRRFGEERVEKEVGEEDRKLLANIRKRERRAKKKKNAAKEEDGDDGEQTAKPQQAIKSAYDQALHGSDESEGDDSDVSDMDEDEPPMSRTAKKGSSKDEAKKTKDRSITTAYLHEDDDEPLDLLDAGLAGRVSAMAKAAGKARTAMESGKFKRDEDGRMVFEDSDLNEDGDDDDLGLDSEDEVDPYVEAITGEGGVRSNFRGRVKFNKNEKQQQKGKGGGGGGKGRGNKRGRDEVDDGDEKGGMKDVRGRMEKMGVGEQTKKRKKEVVRLGSEFKAKKAGGDVKKGDTAPYGYLPLSQASNTKRKGNRPHVDVMGGKRKGGGRGGKK